jgi:putative ABC transport system permease protein
VSAAETLRSAWEAIASHRSRSLLTVLGILIGIAAVIVTVGIGEGSRARVTQAISALGSNLLVVTPGSTTTGVVRGGLGSASNLTMTDVTALSSRLDVPDVRAVAPVVEHAETMQAGAQTWTAPVIGTTPSYREIRNETLAAGSFFTEADVASARQVAVLGSEVAPELFPGENPVGQTVDIGPLPFEVVGVLNPVGASATSNEDDQVLVPVTTAQDELVGGTNADAVDQILLQATSSSTIGAAYEEANDLLLELSGAATPAEANFTITPETELLSTATSVSTTLTVLLGGIAAISLLVGGIGVMNIMLVSVTERVREIGLRKALGATPRAIRRQFIAEAVLLGLAGGVIGVGLGVATAVVLPHVVADQVVVSVPAVIGAVVVAAGIGLVFGVYPASRAARLAPIDALRTE